MKIGAVSLGWGDLPLPTIFEQLKEMGGECVEINGRPGRHDGLVLDENTIPQVVAWAADAGLEITAVSGYCDFAQTEQKTIDQEIERLLSSCRAAAQMEVRLVRAFVGDFKPDKTFADFRPRIVGAFQQAAAAADQLGVILAVENHGQLVNDGPTLVQLLKDIGATNLGITLDSGNFCWAGRSLAQSEQDIEVVLPHVVNVHIKDGLWRDGDFEFVPAGEGQLDLTHLIGQLTLNNYQGPVQSEYEGSSPFLEGTRRSIEFLKQIRRQAPA